MSWKRAIKRFVKTEKGRFNRKKDIITNRAGKHYSKKYRDVYDKAMKRATGGQATKKELSRMAKSGKMYGRGMARAGMSMRLRKFNPRTWKLGGVDFVQKRRGELVSKLEPYKSLNPRQIGRAYRRKKK